MKSAGLIIGALVVVSLFGSSAAGAPRRTGAKVVKSAADQNGGMGAPQYTAGMTAMSRSDFVEARRLMLLAAEAGHIAAQNHLARMCQIGEGAPRSIPEALEWARRAAAQDDAQGMLTVAFLVSSSPEIPVNRDEAERMLLRVIAKEPESRLGRMATANLQTLDSRIAQATALNARQAAARQAAQAQPPAAAPVQSFAPPPGSCKTCWGKGVEKKFKSWTEHSMSYLSPGNTVANEGNYHVETEKRAMVDVTCHACGGSGRARGH